MSILSSIRNRVALIVGIIFVALLSFVLTDLFNSQKGLFGGASASDIGEINGHTVTVNEFNGRMNEIRKQVYDQQKRELTPQEETQMQDIIWQEMIEKYVFNPQYEELGLVVTDDELAEQMYGAHPSPYLNQWFSDRQTGQPLEQFRGPDGQLSGKAISDFAKKMPAETEAQWAQIETELRKMLLKEKYNTMLRKGFYVTTAQAKREHADETAKYKFRYIVKRYSEKADSLVKVSDEEMMEYYNANQYKFKQREASRSMEYVQFDIFPSADDIAKQREDMTKMVAEYKGKKGQDDSLYVVSMSTSGMYQKKFLYKGQYPVGSDSAFIKAAPGEVLGPFNEGENITLYKVYDHKTSVDSVKVRHILIAYKGGERADPTITRSLDQAKQRADSILRVVKSGKTKMEDIVEKLTDDPGSKSGNKGDYGWFTEESSFVQEFKDAGFKNEKGQTVVVKTAFGYHVIQVLDKTAPSAKTQVVAIEKKVEPSETTIRNVYNKASEFAGKNNTGELFTKACQKDNLNVLKSGEINETARAISGLDNSREIIRWMFSEDIAKGSVSQPFTNGPEHMVVCHLTKILEKGVKPFEEVREMCEIEARKTKKAKEFMEEMNKAKANSLDAWAQNMKTAVQMGQDVTFAQPYIQTSGYEGAVIGTLVNMKPGQLSAPIKGTMGVYVVLLEAVTPAEALTDVPGKKATLLQGLGGRADASASEILKEEANIIDNRGKHF